ncbi:glycine cleavage system H protein-like [Styela clava]|uniref:glycine cleavage system H protein-like n=1 Tax=Styela clava TaxID=7725 RepID=UPI001939C047|nr:glycine cleavage system H protein-like [Styela clava]
MERLVRIGLSKRVLIVSKNILQRKFNQPLTSTSVGFVKRSLHISSRSLTTYFTKEHEWIDVKDGIGTIGITEHAQDQLGDLVYCELPAIETEFSKGDEMAVIESVKAASDLYSPVSGKVVEVNKKLEDEPQLINESARGEGWILKMEVLDNDELKDLLNEDEYKRFLTE